MWCVSRNVLQQAQSDIRVSVLKQVSSALLANHQCGNSKGSHAGIEQAERSVCCANANEITLYRCQSVWSVSKYLRN